MIKRCILTGKVFPDVVGTTASLVANVTKLTDANQQPPNDHTVHSPLRKHQLQFQGVALLLKCLCFIIHTVSLYSCVITALINAFYFCYLYFTIVGLINDCLIYLNRDRATCFDFSDRRLKNSVVSYWLL